MLSAGSPVSLLGRSDLWGLTQLVHPAGVKRLPLQSTGSNINSLLLTGREEDCLIYAANLIGAVLAVYFFF